MQLGKCLVATRRLLSCISTFALLVAGCLDLAPIVRPSPTRKGSNGEGIGNVNPLVVRGSAPPTEGLGSV